MPEKRRKFSPQFKAEAVQMVIETGRPVAEVARDLGVNDGTLGNWVKAWRDANPEPATALSPIERARVSELEEENRRLRMENEFLKKAAASSTGRRNGVVKFSCWGDVAEGLAGSVVHLRGDLLEVALAVG
jgi:transposase-like protein